MKVKDLIGVFVEDYTAKVYAKDKDKNYPKVCLCVIRQTLEDTEKEFQKYLKMRVKRHNRVSAETSHYALKYSFNKIVLLNKNVDSFEEFLNLDVFEIHNNVEHCKCGPCLYVFVEDIRRIG